MLICFKIQIYVKKDKEIKTKKKWVKEYLKCVKGNWKNVSN